MEDTRKRNLFLGIAVLVAFLIGTLGYLVAGEVWYDATYYSAQMFFMNYWYVENGNLLIYVARVLCPVVTAAGIAALLKNFLKVVTDGILSRFKGATAVYYDTDSFKRVGETLKRPVYMGRKINKSARAHVLLLESDMDNLTFYEQMQGKLKAGSKVYIKLENMDSKLLAKSDVYYFNVNEIIARMYWQERNLKKYFENGKTTVKIALLGFDALGEKILDYGLMNNIYSLHQKIEYHIWGNHQLCSKQLGTFDTMNADKIVFHDTAWEEDLDKLRDFQRIIVVKEAEVKLLEALIYLNADTEIDFYNPTGALLADVYMDKKLTGFGERKKVLTEENIKTDALYREAKLVNYAYVVKYDEENKYSWKLPDLENVMEKKWSELTGFTKGSNVACADYHKIRRMVMELNGMVWENLSAEQEELLAEMEHIRWSRYHFVNHWTYAPKRDNAKRRHHLLVPYETLSEGEKQKDRDAVAVMFEERG